MAAFHENGNPSVNSSPPTAGPSGPTAHKVRSPSVVVRLGAWIAAIASLAMVSILASITVAELSSGEARAINLAGSLRMQSYAIAAAVGQGDPDGVRTALAGFERRYLDPDLVRVIPVAGDDKVRRAYAAVGEQWATHYRPAALQAGNRSLQAGSAGMIERIDTLVALVEHGLEAKLQLLRLVQGVSLILLAVVSSAAVFSPTALPWFSTWWMTRNFG